MESIFSIIATCDKLEYEFENKAVLKVPKKLIITATNPLLYYLIVEVSYARLLLITKLMLKAIDFEVF